MERAIKVKCGKCGADFKRWRGDAQRGKTDEQLRCKRCLDQPNLLTSV